MLNISMKLSVIAALLAIVESKSINEQLIRQEETHSAAIKFTPEITKIPLNKMRKQDTQVLPKRFLEDNTKKAFNSKSHEFDRLPDSKKCPSSKVVITIKSSVGHFENRKAIRKSWGSEGRTDAIIVFLLGHPNNDSSLLQQVFFEADNHADIVLGNYIDTYANLTIKSLNGLAWRETHCSEPEFSLSVDDDTFVDLPQLLEHHLAKLPADADFVECSERTVVNGKVWREGRWAVQKEVYSSEKYPNYCNGPCYLMPRSTSQKLFEVSTRTASDIQADDALITGIYRTKLEIPLIQYTRKNSPGWCRELNNRKPNLPQRMMEEFDRKQMHL